MVGIPKVVVLFESSRRSGQDIIRGIAKYSHIHGPWSLYYEPRGQDSKPPDFKSWNANGVIARINSPQKAKDFISMGIPLIARGTRGKIPGVINIVVDSKAIGKMAAEHLLERNLKHFAYYGFSDIFWSQNSEKSFSNRILQEGFKPYILTRPQSKIRSSWEIERSIIINWLKTLPKPIGIMACNDDCGKNIIQACKIVNLNLPDQVSVIGTDNDDLICELCEPSLSSIEMNFIRSGYEAAEILDKLMKGEKVTCKTIVTQPTNVVARRSTDFLAVKDVELIKAVEFIRQNANKKIIQVCDVVEATSVSRRVLEKRFKKEFNRTILDEIKRTQVNHIANMLAETNLSISEIASTLDDNFNKHLARTFKKIKKVNPSEYRKTMSNYL